MSELIKREDAINAVEMFFKDAYIEDADVHCTDMVYEINHIPTASPWHRVEEELPKDGLIGKLVIDTEGQINICRGYTTVTLANGKVVYTDSRIFDVFGEETDLWDDVTHFTHWMPIEPPKEEYNA